MKNEKLIIDNKQIAHVSDANNLMLSRLRIIRLNHNPSTIGLLLKVLKISEILIARNLTLN